MNLYNVFKNQLVKILCALVALFMFNIACEEDEPTPNPTPDPAPDLTYTKQNITYDDLTTIVGSSDKKAATAIIMKGVTGKKDGYTIKKMELVKSDPAGSASVSTASGTFFIRLKGIATVTFNLTLKHASKAGVTIKNCQIVIGKGKAVALTFNKLVKPYIKDGTFTTAEILAKVAGSKTDYKLKEIKNVSPADVAVVDGKTIKMKKIGNFKADLILEHPTKADTTITGAEFEIKKAGAEILAFNKLIKTYTDNGTFSESDILASVTTDAKKAGYILKEIKNLSDANVASISGKSIKMTKAGNFTADLVLEHATKADATITGAEFEIGKATAENLTFNKLTKVYSTGGKFTTAEILGNVQGTKDGYTLKEIKNLSDTNIATISDKSIKMTKAGAFKAKLVLSHPSKADATIDEAAFEIKKATVSLAFDKSTLNVPIDEADPKEPTLTVTGGVAANVKYRSSDSNIATVNQGSGALTIVAMGTCDIIATLSETPTHEGATTKYKLTVGRATPTALNFTTLSDVYKPNGKFTKAQIEAKVTPIGSRYSLKKIENLNPTGIATIDGTNLNFKKVGDFTAKLTFSHLTKADAIIDAATFKITKIPVNLTFSNPLLNVFKGSVAITEPSLSGKAGSTGKVTYGSSDTGVATVDANSGNLTAVAVGTTTITATLAETDTHQGSSASYTLNVYGKIPISLKFDRASLTHIFDGKATVAGATLSGQNTAAGAGVITYQSSDATVVTVANDGKLTLLKVGSVPVTITATQAETATHAEAKASYQVFVNDKTPRNLSFNPSSLTVVLGGASFTVPTLQGAVGGGTIAYTSSDSSVASITNMGALKINKAGSTTITVTLSDTPTHKAAMASYILTVNPKTLAIIGNPTGTTGEWGKALVPNYDVPTSIVDPVGGANLTPTYSYAITKADATTGLTIADTNNSSKFDKTTGAIKAGATTGSGKVTITITRKAIAGKYAEATKKVILTMTNLTLEVDGKPLFGSLSGEWGKLITPNYALPNNGGTILVNGQTLTPTYSYAITKADSTTGLKTSDTNVPSKFDKKTGQIKMGATKGRGNVTVTVTREAIAHKLTQATQDFVINIKRRAMPANMLSYTATTWGSDIVPNLNIPTPNGKKAYDPVSDITFTMKALSSLATDGTKVGGTIDSKTGKITGTATGGTLEVTANFKHNDRYKSGVAKVQVAVKAKLYPNDDNIVLDESFASKTWDKATTKQMTLPSAGVHLWLLNIVKNRPGPYPLVGPDFKKTQYIIDTQGIPTADKANSADYEMNKAMDFKPATAITASNHTGQYLYIRSKTGGAPNKGLRVQVIMPITDNGKYASKTIIGYLRTQQPAGSFGISGTPTGLSAEWGKALKPKYNVPTTILNPAGGANLTPVYTYAITKADASTGLKTADTNDPNKFDKNTAAIKEGATTGGGQVVVTITRAAIGSYLEAKKNVVLTIERHDPPTGISLTASAQDWGTAITPTLTIPTVGGKKAYDTASDVTFTKTQISKLGTLDVEGAIDPKTGKITGTRSSGQLEITATLKQNDRYKAMIKKVQVAVRMKTHPEELKASLASAKTWNKNTTYQMPLPTENGIALGTLLEWGGIGVASVTIDTNTIPSGERAVRDHYELNTRPDFNGAFVTNSYAIGNYIRSKADGAKNKGIRVTYKLQKTANGRYKAKTITAYLRTKQ